MSSASPDQLTINLFHTFEAKRGDATLSGLNLREGKRLLAYFLLKSGEPVSSVELARRFWPAEARNSFAGQGDLPSVRQALRSLRLALGADADRLKRPDRTIIVFDISGLASDVIAFDRLASATGTESHQSYADAISLYKGPLLTDWSDDWAVNHRRRRQHLYESLLRRLAQDALLGGQAENAERWLRLLLAAKPDDEDAGCDLIRLTMSSERSVEAKEALQTLQNAVAATGRTIGPEALALADEVTRQRKSAPPLPTGQMPAPLIDTPPSTENAAEVKLAEDSAHPDDAPPSPMPLDILRPLPRNRRPHNLLVTPSYFLGRESEIALLQNHLYNPRGASHLLTLTGPGGVGKTRIAQQTAKRCAEDKDDGLAGGVWWVDLEDVRDSGAMIRQIAEALNLPAEGAATVRDRLFASLAAKPPLLLALDNAEQVQDVSTLVRDLLAAAPKVTCLITSRRSLGLSAETTVEIRPLPDNDAFQLFEACARRRSDRFEVTAKNRGHIAELCRRLDNLPLALELAAARCAALTPRQMIDRLSERFRLLKAQSGALSPRQQTLRATLDWSYDLLGADEQRLLTQLSVFAGGFRLKDAEDVCVSSDVFEEVMVLRDHSLLSAEIDVQTQETRFALLETIRDYAREKRHNAPESPSDGNDIHKRHAQHFARRAEVTLRTYRTSDEAFSLRVMARDTMNLEAAMEWAAKNECGALFASLALSVGMLRRRHGFAYDAIAPIQAGLAALEPASTPGTGELQGRLLRELAGLWLDRLENEAALTAADAALALSAASGDRQGVALSENLLGQAAMNRGDFAAARAHFSSALIYFTGGPDGVGGTPPVEAANIYNNLGLVERRDRKSGDLDKATTHLNEALRLRKLHGDIRGMAETLNNLGTVAFDKSDWKSARDIYTDALRYEQELGDTYGIARALNNLGEVAAMENNHERAVRCYVSALRLFRNVQSSSASYTEEMMGESTRALGLSDSEVAALVDKSADLPSGEIE